jgi:4-amino-4-deoxy-L-arabinose transferase-like glycosyltransferase
MLLGLLLYLLAFMIAGAFIRQLRSANGTATDAPARERIDSGDWRMPSVSRLLMFSATVLGSIAVWKAIQDRSPESHYGDITLLWIITIGLAIVAVAWPLQRPSLHRLVVWIRTYRLEIGAVSLITLAALFLRVFDLTRFPAVFNGDEGEFATAAVDVIKGNLTDPFQTTFQSHPTLWLFLQAGVMRVFGEDVVGSRLISGIIGAATVPLVYLFVRRNFGVLTALTAASLLAAFHFHLFISRQAQNNITCAFFVILSLWLLDRVIEKRRPIDALLAGLAIGVAQLFYVADRILVPIAAVYVVYAIVTTLTWKQGALTIDGPQSLGSALTVAAGIGLGALPLAAYYVNNPETFNARVNIVSIFGTNWLDDERQRTGQNTVDILWNQLHAAALMPFRTVAGGFYRIPPPFIGWPLVIPVVIGLILATVGFWQRRYFGIAVAYWATVAGLAITLQPLESNRFSMAASLIPILAAIGLVAIARFVAAQLRLPDKFAIGFVAIVVVAISVRNIQLYFDDSDPIDRWSDVNTVVANSFAYDLKALGPGYTVYYGAPPRMFYEGHPNLPFIARGDTGIDVIDPWDPNSPPPALETPTVFFFLPERRGELAIVQQWFPNGELIDRTDTNGEPLYTEYIVRPA